MDTDTGSGSSQPRLLGPADAAGSLMDDYNQAVVAIMYQQECQRWIKNETTALKNQLGLFAGMGGDDTGEGAGSLTVDGMSASRSSSFGELDALARSSVKRKRRVSSPVTIAMEPSPFGGCDDRSQACPGSSPPRHFGSAQRMRFSLGVSVEALAASDKTVPRH